ncbi:putative MFS transporter [Lepidopterella palustris CBS 459.81]|uniref:Putative MFS transporter n=1 Tax=Lepidopterella palustris CBS 459.81 TaxID=1314670 RepID=A0A8E2E8K3_9PEZI|nr:putative MFS transporter [Lepidopterella palustris CBS 459.81]
MATSSAEIRPTTEQIPVSDPEKENEGVQAVRSSSNADPEPPYSIFTLNEKRWMVLLLTLAALFSPISSTIYYPSLTTLAKDLHVSNSLINLTVTTFMIFQGLAPAFIGSFSDTQGRRPAYLACFVIYIGANIGLALQTNYAALLVLRMVQSSGSSGTVALANAVVADMATTSERGTWMGWVGCGALLGPAFGPIIGGLLAQYLGWRAIFWFLTIFAGVYLIPMLLFFPESCRAVVGNGSQRPPPWNTCLLDRRIKTRIAASTAPLAVPILKHRLRFPNPMLTLALLFEKEASLVLISSGLLFAGYYALMASLPSQLASTYGFSAVKIGLCFLPCGAGGSFAAIFTGTLMDRNFQRHARRLGILVPKGRQRALGTFPIERARLEIAIPFLFLGAVSILAFGWVMHYRISLAGPLVLLFFTGCSTTGSFTVLSTLTVDLFPKKPATATAANNITRCWLGAGATALVVPMIERIGTGWTFTFVAGLWLCLAPALWAIMRWGPGMRAAKERKEREKEEAEKAKEEAEDLERGRAEPEKEKEDDEVGKSDEGDEKAIESGEKAGNRDEKALET